MRKLHYVLIGLIVFAFPFCKASSEKKVEKSERKIKFLQLNLWQECTNVENAYQYLVDQIEFINPDIACFCELYKDGNNDPVIPKLLAALKQKGRIYYSAQIDGRAVISKYPIEEKERINKWMCKAVLKVGEKRFAVYSSHSEYRYYTSYYPRGYNDGSENWNKLPAPIVDVDKILSVSGKSDRVQSMQMFIDDAKIEISKGAIVLMSGDLNEPSHLDWQENTKNRWDHNGCVVNWSVSELLYKNGFKDVYREYYPDAVHNPGFTFPADNENAAVDKLTWAPDADERERIDFIYLYPNAELSIEKVLLAGPSGSIVKSVRTEDNSNDLFAKKENSGWPSDHKGVLAFFSLK